MHELPRLVRRVDGECAWWTDPELVRDQVIIALSERGGGNSAPPFAGLNLASHVGDDAAAVDANRDTLLAALGLGDWRSQLTVPEQVHGDHVHIVEERDRGRGAMASSGTPPVTATDALVTGLPDTPLMLLFADCVPVVLVAPGPCVAVAHAGWRGALAGIAGQTVTELKEKADCDGAAIRAYIGAHIGPCHYEVDSKIMSQFVTAFGTVARAESEGLDLGAVVAMSMIHAGVDPCNIARLGQCTAETTDRFFSYRAEAGLTGRHCALACILSSS